ARPPSGISPSPTRRARAKTSGTDPHLGARSAPAPGAIAVRRKSRRAARRRPARLLLLHEVEVGAALLAGGVDDVRLAGGVDRKLGKVEQTAIRRLVARLDRLCVDVLHDELRRVAWRR